MSFIAKIRRATRILFAPDEHADNLRLVELALDQATASDERARKAEQRSKEVLQRLQEVQCGSAETRTSTSEWVEGPFGDLRLTKNDEIDRATAAIEIYGYKVIRVEGALEDTHSFDVMVDEACMIVGAITFMAPRQAEIVSVFPTHPLFPGDANTPTERMCPEAGGVDVAYFSDRVTAFDFGAADPCHPLKIKVRAIGEKNRITHFDMLLFAVPIPAAPEAAIKAAS